MADITSAEEETLLNTFLMDGTAYWLGLTDLAHEGTFRWQESHQEAEYTNWYPGGPNDGEEYDCVWKNLGNIYPGWHDVICTWTSHETFGQIHALCEADL